MTTMISHGNDWTVLFTRPVACVVTLLSVAALVFPLVRQWRESRRAAARREGAA